MKNILVYGILPIVVIGLGILLFFGIRKPVDFETRKAARYQTTIERLKDIRTLQIAYRTEKGQYTASFDTLIDFYKTGQVRVVRQIGSMDDSLAVAQKMVVRDTLRINVKDTLLKRPNFRIDSLSLVPNTSHHFEMRTRMAKVSGLDVPLFEACVPNDILLKGLDRQLIINLNDDAMKRNRYPGLKVGSIDQPNNNAGNWE
jgi:hypothetical protein